MKPDGSDFVTTVGMPELLKHGSVTEIILAGFYEVFNVLGSGFLEAIYLAAMVIVLRRKGLQVEEKPSLPVYFNDRILGRFTPDLLVNGVVIVEAKAVRAPPQLRGHATVSAIGVRQRPEGRTQATAGSRRDRPVERGSTPDPRRGFAQSVAKTKRGSAQSVARSDPWPTLMSDRVVTQTFSSYSAESPTRRRYSPPSNGNPHQRSRLCRARVALIDTRLGTRHVAC
jgi:GxxExxY protein